ncbi:HAD family hydrolase [Egibacter rhizosphaerae]|uniref:HAD family hydrolase n=1 Tax=Egibacter rhizosphaerae TaxID=1670831 RepID=A0A411YLS1_9ACTN|nr:HAD family hydrolase [Egibacter rhizosphaerae]
MILDCDGVLVDSERIAARVDAEVLGELGWPVSCDEVVERFVGSSTDHFVAEVQRRLGEELPSDWYEELARRQQEAMAAELGPVPGVLATLEEIAIPTCVASNGSHEKLRLTLALTGLRDRFDGRVFSADDVPRAKPAPDLFLHAAEAMGAAPEHCVVVEDSPTGVRAAKAAGMRVLAFAGGVVPVERLREQEACLFTDMAELPRLLERG